jgi:uncharacterized membrane protein YhaH (DUF805 family)
MNQHFETLGLDINATQQEIQEAYERLSKELTPENNNNEDFFKEEYKKIQEAYNALSQSSILKNSNSSNTFRSINTENSSSNTSGSVTVTISPEKIEELKIKANENQNEMHVKPPMFQKPFSFEGRIRRLEYGFSTIIYYIWIIISSVIAAVINPNNPSEGLYYVFLIPGLWFWLAQGSKRCHDRGNSGWYQIIPFYGIWMIFADGELGDNEYGPNPKGINRIN